MEKMIADVRSGLLALRPPIPTIDLDAAESEAERFQNETLRPVLKFQHELLVAIFLQYVQERKASFPQLTGPARAACIETLLRRDQPLRNVLLGTLMGHFTLAEYQRYLTCEKEMRKRALDMLIQRLQDQLVEE